MYKFIKRKFNVNYKYACFISLIAGAVIFIILYGYHIVNPLYFDWIKLEKLDFKQHYYGWLFFNRDSWAFPLGMFDSLSFPNKISILYTDSIPIVAIFFKLILRLFKFSGEFQYFGLYGLICFMLQSFFGMQIARRFIRSNIASIAIGCLFCLSFTLLYGMFHHTALTSHWLLLFSMAVLVWNNILIRKKLHIQCILFGLIGFLSAGIHIYLVLMCAVFLFGYSLFAIRNSFKKKIKIL